MLIRTAVWPRQDALQPDDEKELPCVRGGQNWTLNFQPLLANCTIFPQLLRRALEHDVAVAHDVQALRNVERDRQLLFHQQDRHAAILDFVEQLATNPTSFGARPSVGSSIMIRSGSPIR